MRGLTKLRRYLTTDGIWWSDDDDIADALAWIAMWVEAGAAMLPDDLR